MVRFFPSHSSRTPAEVHKRTSSSREIRAATVVTKTCEAGDLSTAELHVGWANGAGGSVSRGSSPARAPNRLPTEPRRGSSGPSFPHPCRCARRLRRTRRPCGRRRQRNLRLSRSGPPKRIGRLGRCHVALGAVELFVAGMLAQPPSGHDARDDRQQRRQRRRIEGPLERRGDVVSVERGDVGRHALLGKSLGRTRGAL